MAIRKGGTIPCRRGVDVNDEVMTDSGHPTEDIIVMMNPDCPQGGHHQMTDPSDPHAHCIKCGAVYDPACLKKVA